MREFRYIYRYRGVAMTMHIRAHYKEISDQVFEKYLEEKGFALPK
jgi:hypothetical protein